MEELIKEKGFENLGVRSVAERAGVDKTLIYRYFDSLDGLMYACLKRHDFWSNVPVEVPDSDIKGYTKELFRRQVIELRSNDILRRLLRWELSNDHHIVSELRRQREENGIRRIEMISAVTKIAFEDLAAISSIITGGICYLMMLEETVPYYNGIDIKNEDGWERLLKGIDNIIDLKYNEKDR